MLLQNTVWLVDPLNNLASRDLDDSICVKNAFLTAENLEYIENIYLANKVKLMCVLVLPKTIWH